MVDSLKGGLQVVAHARGALLLPILFIFGLCIVELNAYVSRDKARCCSDDNVAGCVFQEASEHVSFRPESKRGMSSNFFKTIFTYQTNYNLR